MMAAPGSGASAEAPSAWVGPEGTLLPFQSTAETLDFLRTAEVVSWEPIGQGINDTRKVLLEKDGIQANAIFRDVHIAKDRVVIANRATFFFKDEALFELAAYELAQMLGLDQVPPVVERRLFKKDGTLQLWIENAVTEKKRSELKTLPPDLSMWRKQVQILHVFDNLIYNEDRNPGNILFDPDWKLWMVDHTRAFRRHTDLPSPDTIQTCERVLWEKLQNLKTEDLRENLKRYLSPAEIKGLTKRLSLVVELIDGLIRAHGERSILFDFPVTDLPSNADVSTQKSHDLSRVSY
jgi:hypothetical protein